MKNNSVNGSAPPGPSAFKTENNTEYYFIIYFNVFEP